MPLDPWPIQRDRPRVDWLMASVVSLLEIGLKIEENCMFGGPSRSDDALLPM